MEGFCDPAFRAVREVFEDSFTSGQNLGAGVAVFVDGKPVVDLWGGIADSATGRLWGHDTPCVAFSCTKGVTATAALMVIGEAGADISQQVSTLWPEYAQAGKEETTLADLLTHRAGLPCFDRPISVQEAADPVATAALLAGQAPLWTPGTRHGYHALTFGWLAGELVRRRTGQTVGEFVHQRISRDLWLGAPPEIIAKAARISHPPVSQNQWSPLTLPVNESVVQQLTAAYQNPQSLMMRATANPAGSFNNPLVLAGGWPGAGLVTTPRALAAFYRDLIAGNLLSTMALRDAVRERVRGADEVLLMESAFGLGYMRPSANFFLPDVARPTAFGHPGAGGSIGLGDLEHRVAIAFIPNLRRDTLAGDRRAYDIVGATYSAL